MMSSNINMQRAGGTQNPSRAAKRQGIIPLICMLLWIAAAFGSILMQTRPIYVEGIRVLVVSPLQRAIQLGAGAFIVVGLLASVPGIRAIFRQGVLNPWLGLPIALSAVLMTATAMYRASFMELAYIIILYGSLILSAVVWNSQIGKKFLPQGIFLISCATIVIALLLYGAPRDRWIGGIHPNIMGFLLIISGIFGLSRRSAFGIGVFIASLALAVAISSRYALLFLILSAAIDILMYSIKRFGVLAAFALSTVFSAFSALSLQFLAKLFLLDDRYRGVASGASGRVGLNVASLESLSDHILFGVGFRNRTGYLAAHNGFINFMHETGVLVSLLWFLAIIVAVSVAISFVLRNQGRLQSDERAASTIFVISVASAALQPQLINFGDGQGVTFVVGLGLLFCMYSAKSARQAPQCRAPAKTARLGAAT